MPSRFLLAELDLCVVSLAQHLSQLELLRRGSGASKAKAPGTTALKQADSFGETGLVAEVVRDATVSAVAD